ncbi:MAG: hypothetical protein IJY42_06780 [Clostridia bacterium]|nr:hypothetical protein [Clostridia bacterium]MBQ8345950.1 hypothetical protein [Clostridia bacterium]
MPKNKVAKHKTVADSAGYRFLFYCDLSDAHVCTTKGIYHGDTLQEALLLAWQSEGRVHFNQCHKCGRWVIDAVYNAEVLECVDCAPYEAEPRYCKYCGSGIENAVTHCPSCGKKLIYEGSVVKDDAKDAV